jgi:hypothetical protein
VVTETTVESVLVSAKLDGWTDDPQVLLPHFRELVLHSPFSCETIS